ncbi:Serine/threonine protein kinase [uncultured Leptolyngbya sp.]|uniref:Serine/threonine protein kinase n=1 Tax=uncultured Leptolyngbya sp. TaxID=332963 RepID=A0A6J4PFV0_9CYAN|nr:Serine/threonine protein kinase [uncultured Leptolyngbya sp.]
MSYLLAKELKRSKYRLLGLVGQGQFGQVYCASHRKTGRLVALKELDKKRFPTHKFLRELRFLLSLQHDNIVTCHALEHTSTGRYLVMDYCEGGTLRGLMEDDVRLHPSQCLKLVTNILAGLDHAHHRGIVHCDIKPENILLTLQADGWRARISDFGIARLHQDIISDGSGNTGSPAYMAPERFYGQYSITSDLYAVGVLLFELLVGYRPFSGVPIEMMSAHLNRPVSIPDTVPAALQAVILTALQKLPARRFQSATEMLKAVQTAAATVDFDRTWADTRLLRASGVQPVSECHYVQQETLQARVQQLVTVAGDAPSQGDLNGTAIEKTVVGSPFDATGDRVYQVHRNDISCRIYAGRLLAGEAVSPVEGNGRSLFSCVRLPQAVKELLVRPQGCFAIMQRSIYRVPVELFQTGVALPSQKQLPPLVDSTNEPLVHLLPELVAEFSGDFLAAIEAKGRWMAVAAVEADNVTSLLDVWTLSPIQSSKPVSCNSGSSVAPRLAGNLFHLAMVDSRYVVAFSHLLDKGTHSCITGVLLEVFTRRGHPVITLSLPVPLRHLSGSATPYRMIALEPGQPHSVLLIDLKPLKLLRVGVDIVPILIASAAWGDILMAADGNIVVLDRYGLVVGRIVGPANPTAIAVLEPHGLLIATWAEGQGTLVTIDLKQVSTGILF